LLFQAQGKYNLDLNSSLVIGDRWSDMAAGGAVGAGLILVRTGRGEEALTVDRAKWEPYQAAFIADNLLEAVKWLTKNYRE
jgi:histidinol phosphatase-like enzyme